MKPSKRVLKMYNGLSLEQLAGHLDSNQAAINTIHKKRAALDAELSVYQQHRTAIAMVMEQTGVLVEYMNQGEAAILPPNNVE